MSLWEFWLLEDGVLEGKSQMQGRLLASSLHLNTPPVPWLQGEFGLKRKGASLICNLQLHVHMELLWDKEAEYHRKGRTEGCVPTQSDGDVQPALLVLFASKEFEIPPACWPSC